MILKMSGFDLKVEYLPGKKKQTKKKKKTDPS